MPPPPARFASSSSHCCSHCSHCSALRNRCGYLAKPLFHAGTARHAHTTPTPTPEYSNVRAPLPPPFPLQLPNNTLYFLCA